MSLPFEAATLAPEQGVFSRAVDLGHTILEGAQGLFEDARDAARNMGAIGLTTSVAALGGLGGAAVSVGAESAVANSANNDAALTAGAAPTAAACQTEALRRPGKIKGVYQSMTDPNNHWYTETFTLPSVANCNSMGKRVVHYFQETNRDGGGWTFAKRTENAGVVTTTVVPKINSDTFTVAGNRAKKVHGFFRAPHFCVSQGVGLTNSDKVQGAKGRPAAEVTWKPNNGSASVTKIFTGQASKLCK